MSESKTQSLLGNFQPLLIVAMICGTIVFALREYKPAANVTPSPQPVVPQPLVSLDQRVKQAMASDPAASLKYAALYATAQGVVTDKSRTARQIQSEIARAKDLMGLESTDQFQQIVREQLKPFGGANPDREAWQAKLSQLSEACRGAAQ